MNWYELARPLSINLKGGYHISCPYGYVGRGRVRVRIKTRDYFLKLAKKRARSVLTSGGLEPVADSGGEGGHSVFTSAFIDALKENQAVFDADELFSKIRRPVQRQADQTPESADIRRAGHEGGNFLFVKQKKEIASISPEVSKPKIIGRDGTLIAYSTGVVYDKKTGLEWIAGSNKDTTWDEAKKWVESLNIVGGGWRMPTRKELKTLYKKGSGSFNMTPLLKTTQFYVWSGEPKDSSWAWFFGFRYCNEDWSIRDISINTRGFAVRSRR